MPQEKPPIEMPKASRNSIEQMNASEEPDARPSSEKVRQLAEGLRIVGDRFIRHDAPFTAKIEDKFIKRCIAYANRS